MSIDTPGTSNDRRVHASCDEFEVVRYDRAGKWFQEYRGTRKYRTIRLREAVRLGVLCWRGAPGGNITFDLPGGSAFDREVRKKLRT
jgi:hypothetical protein